MKSRVEGLFGQHHALALPAQLLQLGEHFFLPALEVYAELVFLARVVEVVVVEAGFAFDCAPDGVFDFCEVGLVHALEAFAQSAVVHHLVQDLLEESFLSAAMGTRQRLLSRCRSQKASSLWMPRFSTSSRRRALLAIRYSMNWTTSASVAIWSETASSRFSLGRRGCLGFMTKRGRSGRQVDAFTPSRMLMGRQKYNYCLWIVQQYQFVMGNTCQNCEKPTNPKEGIKQEAAREDKAARAGEDAAKPYRPSLSKNDEKYFSNLDQTGERPTSSTAIEKKDPVKFKNGVIYHGEWRGSIRWGFGVQVWPDGAKYEGEWAGGKANGKGKFTHVDGDVYEGDWKDDKACGYGTYKHYNGAKYEGEWLDDYQHGKGTETWVDGSRYEGYYAEGKKNGEGKYTWKDGSYFVGCWKDNKINGFGVYVWSDGRQYKGDWLNNQMHGHGEYKWKDGRMYVGHYEYDKKHGFGTYTWADGRKYSGDWQNSKRHGRGKIISLDGTEREGVWDEDRRVKWLDDGITASAGPSASAVAAEGRTTKKN